MVFGPPRTVGARFGRDGPSRGPPSACLHPPPLSEPRRRPGPSPRSSPPWLFPRYVHEVIQRGRSCVRPACTPVLSVVPAVSDLELSETEYVRSRGSRSRLPRLPWRSRCAQDRTWGAASEELEPAGLQLPVSVRGDAGRPRVTRGQQAGEEAVICHLRSGPFSPTRPYSPELSARRWGSLVCDGRCLLAWHRGHVRPRAMGTRSLALYLRGMGGLGLGAPSPQAGVVQGRCWGPHVHGAGHPAPALLLRTAETGSPTLSHTVVRHVRPDA